MLSTSNQREPSQHTTIPTTVWIRRLIILLTILAALALVFVILWGASHIITALLIFAIAALIAYAIAPAVDLFRKIMPRPLAILAAYLIVIVLLGMLLYLIISTMVTQLTSLAQNVSKLLVPTTSGQAPPLVNILMRFGLTTNQIQGIAQQVESQLTSIAGTVAGGIVPVLGSVLGVSLNILLTVVTSIYLLVDGTRATAWLQNSTPISQQGRIRSLLGTIELVVGGYIRGQITLCLIIGTLVGVGTAILGLGSYAVLLGVFSFFAEFIPVLGSIISGVVAILLALTQGWLTTILVLVYFVLVHIFEGYFLTPRLVGKAVGLRPVISLLALTVGAELFGAWGAIFATPLAGVSQALIAAFWTNYRKTHSDEFLPVAKVPDGKRAEELAPDSAPSALPVGDETVKKD